MPTRSLVKTFAVAAAALLTTAGISTGTAAAEPPPQSALGSYIVTLEAGTEPSSVAGLAAGLGGSVKHVYTSALTGFAVTLPSRLAERLATLPGVVSVEADQQLQLSATQPSAPWGLDRTDQQALPLSGTWSYNATGAGVKAYVIDSGINLTHSDFGGRAVTGADLIDGGAASDCNGHGTHVAGTVGGTRYGIAKQVSLVAVRVFSCTGSTSSSTVLAGVDWVTRDHQAGQPAVANMSLGGGISTALDSAVAASIADGVTYVIAAGNGDARQVPLDACTQSPARVPAALTVGASDRNDQPGSFSNYGACVDLFAPGVGITSDWYTSSTATRVLNGTSMAAPHVAGVAALYLQTTPGAAPSAVSSFVKTTATQGRINTTRTAENDLLFSAL